MLEPSILGPAAEYLVLLMALDEGEHVLDVGCGTGAASLAAARQVGRSGRVVGVDMNVGMITVARARTAEQSLPVEWLEGSALALPAPDGEFGAAICAQTLQFIPERVKALAEMRRVLKPTGRIGVSLWCDLDRSPYFDALVRAISTHIGPDTANGLRAAFGVANPETIELMFVEAGFESVTVAANQIDIDLPLVQEFVPRHVAATPMAEGWAKASSEQRDAALHQIESEIDRFRTGTGIRVPFWSYFVTATR